MLHDPKPKDVRSAETVRNNTAFIATLSDNDTPDTTVEVRRLLSRKGQDSQHFIVINGSDILSAKDSDTVKSIAEVAIRDQRLYFITLPTGLIHQASGSLFLHSIQTAISDYMLSTFQVQIRASGTWDGRQSWSESQK